MKTLTPLGAATKPELAQAYGLSIRTVERRLKEAGIPAATGARRRPARYLWADVIGVYGAPLPMPGEAGPRAKRRKR